MIKILELFLSLYYNDYRFVMKFGVFTNINKDSSLSCTASVIRELESNGVHDIFLCKELSGKFGYPSLDIESLCSECDCVITLGGDGTILKIASSCARSQTLILAINLGTVGFLTEVEPSDLKAKIGLLCDGKYEVENRSMIKSTTKKGTYYSLNEIMVCKSKNLKMVPTEVYIDGSFYYCYYADGVLVSTPTGSTAYSLSAGGPVLSPELEGFVINSVCPHSLQNKSVVVSKNQIIDLKTSDTDRAVLCSDGEYVEELEQGSSVRVEKSDYDLRFIRFGKVNFYGRLIEKLNRWSKI